MVTDHNLIARPYAKAAFDYAMQTQTSQVWAESLAVLTECVENQHISETLRSPTQGPEANGQLLLTLTKGCLSEAVQRFVVLLAENKRLLVLPQINVLFDQLLKASQNACWIDVITPFELSDTQKNALLTELTHYFSERIQLRYDVDPKLLGGVMIKAADKVIDASFAGQLKQLTAALLAPETS